VDHDALIRRLAGNGRSGGGFSLPDAFRAVAESLLEVKMSSVPDLAREVAATPLGLREKRILANWGSWEEFTRDILRVMEHEGLVISLVEGELWALGPSFQPGQAYPVIRIPERDLVIEFTALLQGDKSMKAMRAKHALALAEVRAQVAADGLLLTHTDDLFERLLRELRSGKRPNKRGRPRIGLDDEPEDQPDRLSMCTKCGRDLPLTRNNFIVFRSRGLWYWRRDCHQCNFHNPESVSLRKTTVADTIQAMTVDGIPPSGREVMRALGLNDDRQLRNYWDQLAAEGKVVPRQKAAP
jgi:hypothetical protein